MKAKVNFIKSILFCFFFANFIGLNVTMATPSATISDYFETTGGGFLTEVKDGILVVKYSLALKKLKEIPADAFIEVEFQNPKDKSKPILIKYKPNPADQELNFESPSMNGFKAYKNYKIIVRLYENDSKIRLLGTHEQSIQSILNA